MYSFQILCIDSSATEEQGKRDNGALEAIEIQLVMYKHHSLLS